MLQKNRDSVTIESGVKSEFKIKKRIRSAGSSGQLMGWKQNEEGLRLEADLFFESRDDGSDNDINRIVSGDHVDGGQNTGNSQGCELCGTCPGWYTEDGQAGNLRCTAG